VARKIKKRKLEKKILKEILPQLKEKILPNWLKFDKKKFEGKIIAEPSLKEVQPLVEISTIFEFYSR